MWFMIGAYMNMNTVMRSITFIGRLMRLTV